MTVEEAFTKPMKYDNFITFNGQTKTLKEWAKNLGIAYSTLTDRIRIQKMPIENAFSVPINTDRHRYIVYNGKEKPLSEWAKQYNIGESALKSRLNKSKWYIEKALTTPVKQREHPA
jgi:hypothetical protein